MRLDGSRILFELVGMKLVECLRYPMPHSMCDDINNTVCRILRPPTRLSNFGLKLYTYAMYHPNG